MMVDRVQRLLSAMDVDNSSPEVTHSTIAAAASASSAPTPQHPVHTKIVFLYSDDDDNVQSCGHDTSPGCLSGTNAQEKGTENGTLVRTIPQTRVVSCPDPLQPDAETLMQLQMDAQNACDGKGAESEGCGYAEDVAGFAPESLPFPPIPSAISMTEGALASAGIRAQVVPIVPYSLNVGNRDAKDAASVAGKQQLRRGLTTEELARFQGRRRLRSGSDEDAEEANSNIPPINNKKTCTEEISDEGKTLETGLAAIVDNDGFTVRAIRNGPYCLTVDERDLIEGEQGQEEETVSCERNDKDSFDAAGADALPNVLNDEHGPDDDDGDDDDDSDADSELDECLIVAVVEQLVQCCESEDLDPNMQREASRFLGVAKPLLTQLGEGTISSSTFSQLIERDLRRFNRIFKSVNRPRDEPIVIGGVQMDL